MSIPYVIIVILITSSIHVLLVFVTVVLAAFILVYLFCLSNALHSSIVQNIKSLAASGVRCPVSRVRSRARV